MKMYIMEEADVNSLHEPGFYLKKRITYSDAVLNQTLFRTEDDEYDHHISKGSSTHEKSFVIFGKTRLSTCLFWRMGVANPYW